MAELARSPAELARSPAELARSPAELTRSPAAFFARSHTATWQAEQLERAAKLLGDGTVPGAVATPEAGAVATVAAEAAALARVRKGWCAIAAAAIARELQQPSPPAAADAAPAAAAPAAASASATPRTAAAASGTPSNTLLRVWRERTLEAIDLMHAGGVAAPAAYDSVLPPLAPSAADKEPPAPPLVKRWRQMDRQWPCWSMAFAVPSEGALTLLAQHAPIIEMGAGTGYWVHLLQARGVDACAFDARPPLLAGSGSGSGSGSGGDGAGACGSKNGGKSGGKSGGKGGGSSGSKGGGGSGEAPSQNTFHGGCPAFTTVLPGSPKLLAETRWRQHTLFLCYPPNGRPMARECLEHFGGSTLVHVGEWRGDTGDASFEASLAAGWELRMRLPLPCWGDTMEDLTVWHRRATPLATAPTLHPILSCDHCGAAAALAPSAGGGARAGPPSGTPSGGAQLRRCRYCRLACYCSATCARAAHGAHLRYHAAKCVTVQRPLDFDGSDFYSIC